MAEGGKIANDVYRQFIAATNVLEEVYQVTLYGQRHREVQALKLLHKFGANTTSSLSRKDLQRAVAEVNAMIKGMNESHKVIELTRQEVNYLKKIMRQAVRSIRKIPALARAQGVITLAANFEGYVADLIRSVFEKKPDTLKSGRSTLKDEELVEALKVGDALSILREHRIRDVMYGSVKDWLSFLRGSLGFGIDDNEVLVELFLIRNCLIHNNGRISKELESTGKHRFQRLNKPINVTERDLKRYVEGARRTASDIWEEYERKFGR